MSATSGLEELLSTGSWTPSRTRNASSTRVSRASSSTRDADPRTRVPRGSMTGKHPPAPSVEDELESLAREHGPSSLLSDEGPQYIGEVNQNPVIVEVPENNPERRFVLVTQPEKHVPQQTEAKKPAAEGRRKEKGPEGSAEKLKTANESVPLSNPPPSGDRPRQTPKSSPVKGRDPEQAPPPAPLGGGEAAGSNQERPILRGKDGLTTKHEGSSRQSTKVFSSLPRGGPGDVGDGPNGTEVQEDTSRKIEQPVNEKRASHGPAGSIPAKSGHKEPGRQAPDLGRAPTAADSKQQAPARFFEEERERPAMRRKDRAKSDYEANTCRKYVLVAGNGGDKKAESPSRQQLRERKSRQELHRIETNNVATPSPGRAPVSVSTPDRRARPSRHRRSFSHTNLTQEVDEGTTSSHGEADSLSPAVIRKHSTRRHRDEAYYDDNITDDQSSRRRGKSFHEPRSTPPQRKDLVGLKKERDTQSASPAAPRRTPSSAKSLRDWRGVGTSEAAQGRGGLKGGFYQQAATPVAASENAYSVSSPRNKSDPKRRRRQRPWRDSASSDAAVSSSSDEGHLPYPRSPRRSPASSFVNYPDERGFLLMPSEPTDSELPVRAKRPSPLPSPRASSHGFVNTLPKNPPETETGPISSSRTRAQTRLGLDSPATPHSRIPREGNAATAAATTMTPPNPPVPIIANPSLAGRPRSPVVEPYRFSAQGLRKWRSPSFGGLGSAALTYRGFLKGVSEGSFDALPICSRRTPQTGYHGWLTLPRCDDFRICASCYEQVFEGTEYGPAFIPTPFRAQNLETACSFGSSYWYQIAWFLTLKYTQPDLRILMSLADIIAGSPPCPGAQRSRQSWYSIRDPLTRELISNFSLCRTCVTVIGALLPSLAMSFESLHSRSQDGQCTLHCEFTSHRSNFLEYFDALESVADVSMKKRTPPDLDELSAKILSISTVAKCPKDIPVHDNCWYLMRSARELTACQQCFDLVVKPWIKEDSAVAKDFYMRPSYVPVATCQLYSERMRISFDNACSREDIDLLRDKVKERKFMEGDIKARIRSLVSKPALAPWEEDELDRLSHEWAEWE